MQQDENILETRCETERRRANETNAARRECAIQPPPMKQSALEPTASVSQKKKSLPVRFPIEQPFVYVQNHAPAAAASSMTLLPLPCTRPTPKTTTEHPGPTNAYAANLPQHSATQQAHAEKNFVVPAASHPTDPTGEKATRAVPAYAVAPQQVPEWTGSQRRIGAVRAQLWREHVHTIQRSS